jgi:hypothetical protein
MNEQEEDKIAKVAVAGGYLSIALLGAWKLLRGNRSSAKRPAWLLQPHTPSVALPPGAELGDEPPTAPQPQDLTPGTPGAAPLDLLARTATEEVKETGESALEQDWPNAGAPKDAIALVLAHQSLESPLIMGWSRPQPTKLPLPTYAPAIMAFGIVLFAMGLATTWYVCVVGAIVFAIAAHRWTAQLQGE